MLDNLSSVHGNLNFRISKVPDVIQAFKFPIWDQNGNMLRYEILLDQDEFDYIVANDLYSLDGQAAFSMKGGKVSFPMDNPESGKLGAMELKLAWKVLDPSKGDLPERFLTVHATIFSGPDGTTPTQATLGLVAMHISHRTLSSPQWIWSTFIHVDSLQTNSLATFHGKPIPTLFYNPGNPTAPVNVPSQTAPPFLDGQTPTQVLALTAIPLATQEVNRVARHELERRGSVLQYFELMNTQWPTSPATPPTPPGMLPASIDNKAGGRPTPVYLINPLLETYFQAWQSAGGAPGAGRDRADPGFRYRELRGLPLFGPRHYCRHGRSQRGQDGRSRPRFLGRIQLALEPSRPVHEMSTAGRSFPTWFLSTRAIGALKPGQMSLS